jgi:hypothetical protein
MKRILSYSLVQLGFVAALTSPAVQAGFFEKCKSAVPDQKITVALSEKKTIVLNQTTWHMGLFEIHNNLDKDITLQGEWKSGDFILWDPEAYLNVQSDDGTWDTPFYPVSDGTKPPDSLVIRPGSSAKFMTRIELGYKLNAKHARVALNFIEPGACIVSQPFDL